MVKTLDPVIKEAFKKAGFEENEVIAGCWLLEKPVCKGSSEMKPIAWIALHKFLERVAQRMHIVFDEPKVMNCTPDEVALYVRGTTVAKVGEMYNQAWSIGEASPKNCKNEYRWAMAEKRAKDRVILKLLGIAGDMYSEEEADEFKQKPVDNRTPAEKAKETREANRAAFEQRFAKMYEYFKGEPKWSYDLDARFTDVMKEAIKLKYESDKCDEMLAIFGKLQKDVVPY